MKKMYLSDMFLGDKATVLALPADAPLPARLLDMGLVAGTKVLCLGRSGGGHLGAYGLRGAMLGIRCEDARRIPVMPLGGDDFG